VEHLTQQRGGHRHQLVGALVQAQRLDPKPLDRNEVVAVHRRVVADAREREAAAEPEQLGRRSAVHAPRPPRAPPPAPAQRPAPPAADTVTAVRACASPGAGCCTSAGPRSPWEKIRQKLMTSSAADTTPKSCGPSSRASTASTRTVSTACAPVPSDSHNHPASARSVRL